MSIKGGFKFKEALPEMLDRKSPAAVRQRKHIIQQQLFRTRQDMSSWRYSLQQAESIHMKNRNEMVRLYKDIELDPHISAVIDNRKAMTLSKRMTLTDSAGEINEEWTEKFNRMGMKKIYEWILDSAYWGYSLIELGSIVDDTFIEPKKFPLEYVRPEDGVIIPFPQAPTEEGWSYEKGRYSLWYMGSGDRYNFGLFNKIAPYYIVKKNNINSWAVYSERFGEPIITLKTNVSDQDKRGDARNQLLNAGSGSVSVLDLDEEIEFIEANTGTGYATYKELTEMCDKQVSKLVLGATMISDDGSSFSQSTVHESVAEDKMKFDMFFLETEVSDKLIPQMRKLGINIPEGLRLEVENKEEVSGEQLFEQVIELEKVGLEVNIEWITKRFNIPIDDRQENMYTKYDTNGDDKGDSKEDKKPSKRDQ